MNCIYFGCYCKQEPNSLFCYNHMITINEAKKRVKKNKGVIQGRLPKFTHSYGSSHTHDLVDDLNLGIGYKLMGISTYNNYSTKEK